MAAMTLTRAEVLPPVEWAQRLPSAYAASTVSSWSIVHSYLLDQENISYRLSCSSCWGGALQKCLSSVVSNEIGVKFGTIVPQVNTHRLTDLIWFDVRLSRWRPWLCPPLTAAYAAAPIGCPLAYRVHIGSLCMLQFRIHITHSDFLIDKYNFIDIIVIGLQLFERHALSYSCRPNCW